MNKVIITGSPGTGKSALLTELKNDFDVVEEVSRALILENKKLSRDVSPWGDVVTFSELALERMIQQYRKPRQSSCCIFDRAIPDVIVALLYRNKRVPSRFYRAVDKYLAGSLAFFTPPWREIYVSDDLRPESFEETLSMSELTKEVYENLGFQLIELDKQCLADRVTQMKKNIPQSIFS